MTATGNISGVEHGSSGDASGSPQFALIAFSSQSTIIHANPTWFQLPHIDGAYPEILNSRFECPAAPGADLRHECERVVDCDARTDSATNWEAHRQAVRINGIFRTIRTTATLAAALRVFHSALRSCRSLAISVPAPDCLSIEPVVRGMQPQSTSLPVQSHQHSPGSRVQLEVSSEYH